MGLLHPEAAEALAALEAIRLAAGRGWSNVIIEGDCLNLIEKIQLQAHDTSPIGNILLDIDNLSPRFDSINFCFSPREANSVAYTLARHAAPASSGGFNVPVVAFQFIQVDMSNVV